MADESTEELESALERVIGMGASDLTQRALAGQLARAYAREAEVAKVFESLAARRGVLLLGPADVGKTAILHEAVARIARKQAPAALAGKRVVSISTGAVMVGTKYLGEWQTRLGELLDAIKQAKDIILCFEDIWALRDAGRASDKADGFSNFLRPYLERGEMVVIGECTPETFAGSEYGARALADDPSLLKHFTVVRVEEPDRDVTKGILAAVARDLQRAHHVRVEPAAIERALELTRRFLPYAAFPGKAKRLLDEAAQLRAPGGAGEKSDGGGRKTPAPAGDPLVDADTVTAAFSRMTGLPEKIISDAIPISQEEMRAYFDERVVGQEEAVAAVVDVVTLVKAELNDPGRPLGVLFFVGPTGVGKTELAKTLAEYLFGSKEKLIRLDMSEFKTAFGTADLLRQITEKQRRQHFSVLLLDEIEKANSYVFDLFLQAFDDARISDSSGRTVDLRNTIIVMTSNIGTELSEARGIGFLEASGGQERAQAQIQERARQVARAVEEYFRPEFINRLDKIVVFQPLGRAEMRRIARRELGRALMREGVLRRNILLDFREEVLDALLAAGFSPTYGARPLQRAIKDLVLLPLARRIAAQPATGEQLLELCVVDGRIDAAIIPMTAATQPEPSEPPERDERGEMAGGAEALARRASPADLRQLQGVVAALRERIEAHIAGERFGALQERTRKLLEQSTAPSFWDDNERARRIFSTIYHLERVTDRVVSLRGRADDLTQVAEMIRRHGDTAGIPRLAASLEQLEQDVSLAELELFAGDADAVATDAVFIRVTPVEMLRAREAGDWPARLAEMYARWAGRKGHEVETLHADGDDPLLLVRGPNLGAILRGEEGLHKLQEGDEESQRRGRPAPRVRLARVEVLAVPPDDAVRFDGALDPVARGDGRDGERDGDGRGPRMVEVRDDAAGIQIRLRAGKGEMGDQAARDLLAALLVRGRAGRPPADEVVRVYHLMKTSYVRDPRTGARSARPREVLDGDLDAFLLAYLTRTGTPERAGVAATVTVTLPHGEG